MSDDTTAAGRRAKNRLRDMELTFVSLVGAGDNGPAEVAFHKERPERPDDDLVLWKSRPGNPDPGADNEKVDPMPTSKPGTGEKADAGADLPDEVVKYVDDLEDELDAVYETNDLLAKSLQAAFGVNPIEDPKRFQKALVRGLRNGVIAKADGDDDEDPDDDDDDPDDDDEDDDGDGADDELGDDETVDEPAKKKVLVGKAAKAKGKVAKAAPVKAAPVEAAGLDEILKANPALATMFKGLQDQLGEAREEAKIAKTTATKERNARLVVAFTKRGEALADLGDPVEIAKTLARLYKAVPTDLYEAVEEILAGAAEVVKGAAAHTDNVDELDGLFKEFGRPQTGGDALDPADPLAPIAALIAKGTPDGKTVEQAIDEALSANPAAYDEHEVRRNSRRIGV